MKILTATILGFVGITSTVIADDDVIQYSGSWLQVVAQGSLKAIDPSLEKGHVWVKAIAF